MLEIVGPITLVAPAISVLVGIAGLYFLWRSERELMLRRGEVLIWAIEVIRVLKSLELICEAPPGELGNAAATARLADIVFDSSVLVERGRLFFKNQIVDDHGAEKEPAYRGYRPAILDPLVVAHQIARRWTAADPETRPRLHVIAEDCRRRFVSLAQKEVGRSHTASRATKEGGAGDDLEKLLLKMDGGRAKWAK